MLIYYKYDNELFNLKIHKYTSLFSLKENLMKKINNKKVIILFENKILNYLDDNVCLDKIGIKNGSQIRINQKINGGNTFTTILIILIVLLLFIIIPVFLITGYLPFIIHIIGLFVIKIINCSVGFLLAKLPRLHEYKAPITFIIKSGLLFLKLFFVFIAVNNIFTVSYFFWCQILKSSDGLFTVSDSYCDNIGTINTINKVTSYCYIIIYAMLRAPNLFPGTIVEFRNLAKKYKLDIITAPLDTLNRLSKDAVYENKFDFINFIPVIGPIIFGVLEGYFQALDGGIEILTSYLNYIIDLGCSKSININSVVSKTKSMTSNIKSTGKNFLNKVHSATETKKKIENQKGGVKNIIKYNTSDVVKSINKMTPAKNNEFLNILKNGVNKEDFKCNLMDVDGGCCSKSIFQSLYPQFEQMLSSSASVQKMNELGIKKIVELFLYSLNVDQVDKDMNNFYNAFGPFKLLDNNIKAVCATAWRYTICNIFYLADLLNNILLEMGTPLDISDTIKCGMISGNVTLLVYIVCLIIIVFILFL
jgi:hypothetical protein